MSRFTVVVTSLFVIIACGVIPAWTAELDYAIPSGGDFHPPHSVVEKTLDSIFKRDMRDSGVMNYVISAPYRDVRKDEVYARLFTPALRKFASEAEAKEVTEKCGGVYTGDLCGLDFDPILCAQDFPNKGVLYRLESEDKDKAIITTRWPWIEEPLGTYTLIRKGKSWALDGILCQNGLGNFNFRDFGAIKGLTSKPREE